LTKIFTKCNWVEVASAKCAKEEAERLIKNQQPLISMIFTYADPRYASRLDDKQGGDSIVTM